MHDRTADLLTAADRRCPSCAAAVRPEAPWCTLCYTDLREEPASPALDPLTAPAEALGLPPAPGRSWPCTACGASNPYSVCACAACGTGFLAGLRESEGPLLEVPVIGDLTALSRGQRLGLAAGVVLAVIALTALVTLLFS
ncbi:MAG: hypothetical protein ACR2K2_12480 [Mycobacteriales bacterium]